MRLNRLRRGEYVALVGSVALFVVMFLDWYEPRGGAFFASRGDLHQSGWAGVGWFAAAAVIVAILVCGLWLVATVTHDSPALPVAGEVVTIGLSVIATIALLARLVFQPGLGLGLPNDAVNLLWPAYAGPLCAIAMTAGAWLATADERTEAAYSQPGEIELRALPE